MTEYPELTVYDTSLNELGIIDLYKSLTWTRRFYDTGAFQLKVLFTEENKRLLRKNRYIHRSDVDEMCFIKTVIEEKSEDGHFLTVSGCDMKGILDMRVIGFNFVTGSILRSVLEREIVHGIAGCMRLDLTEDEEVINVVEAEEAAMNEMFGSNLGDRLRPIFRQHLKGFDANIREFEVTIPGEGLQQYKSLCGFLHTAADRSTEQTANPQIIFAEEFDNISNTVYNYSSEGCCNAVRGIAIKTDPDVVINDSKAHLLQYEKIEAGVSGAKMTTKLIVIEPVIAETKIVKGLAGDEIEKHIDYEATHSRLVSAVEQAYCEYSENFEADTNAEGYRTEWKLGDFVTVRDEARGGDYKKQVEEVTETYTETGREISIAFGTALKTILDAVKEAGR